MKKYRGYFGVLIVTSLVITLSYLIITKYDDKPKTTTRSGELRVNRRELALQLMALKSELIAARTRNTPPSLSAVETVDHILNSVDPELFRSLSVLNKNGDCHEEYTNTSFAYPYHDNSGWTETCDRNSMDELVTVLLNPPLDVDCDKFASRVIKGIRRTNPNVRVLIGSKSRDCDKVFFGLNFNDVDIIRFNPTASDGKIWNYLVSKAETRFVLVGRDLDHWTWYSRILRQVTAFDINENVRIVGGAARNSTGHWKIGCFQMKMKNYVFQFIEGYYSSRNECMLCDFLTTPFLTSTEYIKGIRFDDGIQTEVLFADFFWRVKMSGEIVLNCPDIMYFATNNEIHKRLQHKKTWVTLVQKYKLGTVIYAPDIRLTYTCEDVGFKCEEYFDLTSTYLMPPCCLDQYSRTWAFIQHLAESFNLKYEIDCGSVMGAIKMNAQLPWDIDGDLLYLSFQHKNWTMFAELFKKNGFKFDIIHSSSVKPRELLLSGGYIQIGTPDNTIEMYGVEELSNDMLPTELRGIPTKVKLGDVWVYSVVNPGLYARNRYGREYLKHAQSWRHTGGQHSFVPYEAGYFNTCPKRNFHACLDWYIPDGNIQFMMP